MMYWTKVRFQDDSPKHLCEVDMRRILLLLFWQFGLLAGGRLFADVVTLKDGRQISGLVESGNIQELHIKAGDQPQTIDIHQVQAIQFGVSLPAAPTAPPPPKAADAAPAAPEPAPAQSNSLILHDGTHLNGRWWSIDATNVHFLVNNQLQHYPRADVLGVTFGNATLPRRLRVPRRHRRHRRNLRPPQSSLSALRRWRDHRPARRRSLPP